ncbi:MAG: peptide chain release factor N(5)-glutamine methyltransferase [bacterium]|nr:peptide chain release factor N(5)-glutamine methyltransferase [bacterium]
MKPWLELKSDIGVSEALSIVTEAISTITDDQPQRQSQWMVAHVLTIKSSQLWKIPEQRLSEDQIIQLRNFLQRRRRREPLQYILGSTEFRHLTLKTDRRALIPRPETEGLVEIGLDFIKPVMQPKILDIGTGSGAIALSLVSEHSRCLAVAVDKSSKAINLARENAELLGLSDRVQFIRRDLFSKEFIQHFSEPFDMIITNPPYVSDGEYQTLAPEIRRYEPAMALLAGEDGCDAIRRLAEIGKVLLKPNGHLISEIGETQEKQAIEIFQRGGWQTNVQKDLSGKPRYLIAANR